ncbi:MAG: hypothetical protein BGO37_09395 [Cellulomonas sp. 73-92]|uniref:hypothetical protein n=1 Tax=Cellulomonas sp. 73-92 TaxID=1895740 RepID=UPI0009280629|nr:hypothetical protein [Cellulomonas sp. 73-92]OJV83469.1 MAG: hypothetical protein BGO37_09395 [Cellulomonas sp. 73-92]
MDETGSGRSNEAFDDRNELDPGDAALLVEQTARQAQRAFDLVSPVAAAVGAGVFLVGYGAVWWSIRGEATYTGSPGWAIGVLYGAIGVAAIVGGTVARRATAGVRGRSARRQVAQAVAVGAAGIGAWMVQGALLHLGVPAEIVYGVYGPTVPLIALAAAGAGVAATRERWPELWLSVAIIAVASLSTFFGPQGAWGLTGLGAAVALLIYASAMWRRRAAKR